jgi:hypothetical protein
VDARDQRADGANPHLRRGHDAGHQSGRRGHEPRL